MPRSKRSRWPECALGGRRSSVRPPQHAGRKSVSPPRSHSHPPGRHRRVTAEEIRALLEAAAELGPRGCFGRGSIPRCSASSRRPGCASPRPSVCSSTTSPARDSSSSTRSSARAAWCRSTTRHARLSIATSPRARRSPVPTRPCSCPSAGRAWAYGTAITTFLGLVRGLGIHPGPGKPGPRFHDLRHTFAVRPLEQCAGNRRAVDRHMLALRAYLGHAHIVDTY